MCRPLACSFAFLAIQRLPEKSCAAAFRHHPRPAKKWRLMPHMLAVPARKIGDPVPMFVLVKADDGLMHETIAKILLARLSARWSCSFGRWCSWISRCS